LFDRQPAELRLSLSDETAVAHYEVRLSDEQGRDEVLAKAEGLEQPTVELPSQGRTIPVDLSGYRPTTQPIELTLTVKAADVLGNVSLQTRRLLVNADQAPRLTWADGLPATQQQRGQPLRGNLKVQDDY